MWGWGGQLSRRSGGFSIRTLSRNIIVRTSYSLAECGLARSDEADSEDSYDTVNIEFYTARS